MSELKLRPSKERSVGSVGIFRDGFRVGLTANGPTFRRTRERWGTLKYKDLSADERPRGEVRRERKERSLSGLAMAAVKLDEPKGKADARWIDLLGWKQDKKSNAEPVWKTGNHNACDAGATANQDHQGYLKLAICAIQPCAVFAKFAAAGPEAAGISYSETLPVRLDICVKSAPGPPPPE
jgi:hypothetical protein